MALASGEQGPQSLFPRVNNAFTHRLVLSFRPENLTVLNYLRASVNDLPDRSPQHSRQCGEDRLCVG